MANLPPIASLWIGERLSFLEQLCLKSYVDQGHQTTLYVYENVKGIPKGVEVKDARDLYRGAPYRRHFRHGSSAIHADYFRLKLMKRGDGEIWVDTDAYCYKPFDFTEAHVFGQLDDTIANGVMRLPPESEALKLYDEFLESEEPDPVFLPKNIYAAIGFARGNSIIIPIEAMPWGTTGPLALTYFLKQTGEAKHVKPEPVFYPMNWETRRGFTRRPARFMEMVEPETVSFHFFGRVVRRILAQEEDGMPKKGSILAELCKAHEIDPKKSPIQWAATSKNNI